MAVEHADWQERGERERVWLSREEAARRVDEPDLQALIAGFEPDGGRSSARGTSAEAPSQSASGWRFWRQWLRR